MFSLTDLCLNRITEDPAQLPAAEVRDTVESL